MYYTQTGARDKNKDELDIETEDDRDQSLDSLHVLKELEKIKWSYKQVSESYKVKRSPPTYDGDEGIKTRPTLPNGFGMRRHDWRTLVRFDQETCSQYK